MVLAQFYLLSLSTSTLAATCACSRCTRPDPRSTSHVVARILRRGRSARSPPETSQLREVGFQGGRTRGELHRSPPPPRAHKALKLERVRGTGSSEVRGRRRVRRAAAVGATGVRERGSRLSCGRVRSLVRGFPFPVVTWPTGTGNLRNDRKHGFVDAVAEGGRTRPFQVLTLKGSGEIMETPFVGDIGYEESRRKWGRFVLPEQRVCICSPRWWCRHRYRPVRCGSSVVTFAVTSLYR